MKTVLVALVVCTFLFALSAARRKGACGSDEDCVPYPECHPHRCVTKSSLSDLPTPPIFCTELYDPQAAYSPSDCACDSGACVNKNLGRNLDL